MRLRERGNALIEFAGALIVLTAVFAGVFEIGYTFFTYGTLVDAVRAGARYSAARQQGDAPSPQTAAAIRNLVVYGDPAPAQHAKPIVAGLTTEDVEIINSPGSTTVSLQGFHIDALFTKVNLNGRPTATFPRQDGRSQ